MFEDFIIELKEYARNSSHIESVIIVALTLGEQERLYLTGILLFMIKGSILKI